MIDEIGQRATGVSAAKPKPDTDWRVAQEQIANGRYSRYRSVRHVRVYVRLCTVAWIGCPGSLVANVCASEFGSSDGERLPRFTQSPCKESRTLRRCVDELVPVVILSAAMGPLYVIASSHPVKTCDRSHAKCIGRTSSTSLALGPLRVQPVVPDVRTDIRSSL